MNHTESWIVRNWPLRARNDGQVYCERSACGTPLLRVAGPTGPVVFNIQILTEALREHVHEDHPGEVESQQKDKLPSA